MRTSCVLAHLLCASTLAVAAAGCGGGSKSYSGTEPSEWAATVCGAVGDWTRELQANGAQNNPGLGGASDLEVVKRRFVAFLESAERSSRTMTTRIAAAGAPAVKDGAAIQRDLVSGVEAAQASLARAIPRAKKLSTTTRQGFLNGLQALGGDVQTELADVGTEFNNTLGGNYTDSTLNKATSEEPSCSDIAG